MLRYIKHNLTGIDGIEIYPIISLLIFILFFTIMFIVVFKMKKDEVEQLSSIPLDDNETNLESKSE